MNLDVPNLDPFVFLMEKSFTNFSLEDKIKLKNLFFLQSLLKKVCYNNCLKMKNLKKILLMNLQVKKRIDLVYKLL